MPIIFSTIGEKNHLSQRHMPLSRFMQDWRAFSVTPSELFVPPILRRRRAAEYYIKIDRAGRDAQSAIPAAIAQLSRVRGLLMRPIFSRLLSPLTTLGISEMLGTEYSKPFVQMYMKLSVSSEAFNHF